MRQREGLQSLDQKILKETKSFLKVPTRKRVGGWVVGEDRANVKVGGEEERKMGRVLSKFFSEQVSGQLGNVSKKGKEKRNK